jgi:hypothetical protein
MPAFVKTPKDEARWAKAKEAAGKETKKDSEGYWKLSNYIYHKMGKTEEDQKLADFYKTELMKSIGQVGKQAVSVKIPKQKRMPGTFAKQSVFFKTEEIAIKHPSVQKLKDFLTTRKGAR